MSSQPENKAPRKEREWDFSHLPTNGALARLHTRRLRLRFTPEVIPTKLVNPDGTTVLGKSALIQLEVNVWDIEKMTRKAALEQFGTIMPNEVINAVRGRVPVYQVGWFAPEEPSFTDSLRVQINLAHFAHAITGTPIENRSKSDRRYIHAVTTNVEIPKDPKDPTQGMVTANKVTHVIVGQFDRRSPEKGYEEGDRILILTPTSDGKPFAEILRIFLRLGLVQKITSRLAEDHSAFAEDLKSKSVETLLEAAKREAEHDDDRTDRDRRRSNRSRPNERADEGDGKKAKPATTASAGAETAAKAPTSKYGWCTNLEHGEAKTPCANKGKLVYTVERACVVCGGQLKASKAQDFLQQMFEMEAVRIATGAPADAWATARLQGFKPKKATEPAPAAPSA